MKICPSCGSPNKEFEITDSCADTLYAFHPSPAAPGYTVDDTRMDDSFPAWDFTTKIQCCECGDEFRAGEILEPEPASFAEFIKATNNVIEHIEWARHYPEDRISRLEDAIELLVKAKNLAARGLKRRNS